MSVAPPSQTTGSSAAEEDTSVRLIAALARIWSRVRAYHPGVPSVVLLPAPAHRDQMNVLGHFAALRWKGRRLNQVLHEVVVIAEHLNRAPEDVLETLLHEAAHALNFERGIKDCSASQYHNKKFKAAAEGLGLLVERVPHYGYARTSLASTTSERYAEEVEALREVLIHRQGVRGLTLPPGGTPPDDDDEDDRGSARSRKAVCGCPFIIRVAKKTIESTTIRCETCGEAFRLA